MLTIRLQRVGRKHEPVYRLVLTDSRNSTKSGKFLEILGSYNSRKAEEANVNSEKVLHWLSKGAQTSDTAHNLLVTRGLLKGKKRNVLSKRPATKQGAEPEQEAPKLAEPEQVEPTNGDEKAAVV